MRLWLAAMLLAITSGSHAVEPITLSDLARSFAASRAMERSEGGEIDTTTTYRAGRFDGYLISLGEFLQARGEVCLPDCFCHVRERFDPVLEALLKEPALDLAQPAQPWLTAQLLVAFPCPGR